MHNVFRYIFVFCITALVAGCAQVRPISGGEKDTTAPAVIASSPPANSIRFTGNGFELVFDEYVQLRDLQKELLVSPPLKKSPKVKVRQRSVEVSWSDTLHAQTTYIFQFGKAITDLNESNVLNDFSFVFSTGDQLDSMHCEGHVVDAFTDKPASGIKVLLFDSLRHVFATETRPAYFARTDEKGRFRFDYLRSGQYVLCALTDENGNNHFDIGESIDWRTDIQTQLFSDSSNQSLQISSPRDTVARSFDYLTDSSGVLKFSFKPWLKPIRVDALNGDSIVQWMSSDTLFAAAFRGCSGRTEVAVRCGETVLDTLTLERKSDDLSVVKLTHSASPKMQANEPLVIQCKRPIAAVVDSLLKCYADSVETKVFSEPVNPSMRELLMNRTPGASYNLVALPGWITDDCGETNDTLELSFSVYDLKDLGSLRFKLPDIVVSAPHFFQLMDRSGRVVYTANPVNAAEFSIEQLIPGDYTAVVCEDANQNGLYDPLILAPFQQGERNHACAKPIQVRANWEVVIDWPSWEK